MDSGVRIRRWDNVKGALIVLVVLGHTLDIFTNDSEDARSLFFFIYIFHMPLFIFVSGLFSKRCVRERNYKKAIPFLVLYFFIKILRCISIMIAKGQFFIELLGDDGAPWYCLFIFFAYLITMGIQSADKKYVLICSVVLACFAGYDVSIGDELVLSRLIVFYPFFYMGYCLEAKDLERIFSEKIFRVIAAVSLVAVGVIVFALGDEIYELRPLLTGRNPFKKLDVEYIDYGALLRFFYYFVVIFIGACFIAVIPEKSKILTFLGNRSLQIYGLHFTVLQLLEHRANIPEVYAKIWPAHFVWLTVPTAILVAMLCSLKVFGAPFDYIRRNGEKKPEQAVV